MKFVYSVLLLFASAHPVVFGQKALSDSLRKVLEHTREDTSRVLLLVQLSSSYVFYQPDSAIILAQQAIQNAQSLHFSKGVVRALIVQGNSLRTQGDLPQALKTQFHALQVSRTIRDPEGEASSLLFIGTVYVQLGEYRQGLRYFQQARQNSERTESVDVLALSNIGDVYEKMNQLDSALHFQLQANDLLKDLTGVAIGNRKSLILARLGIIQARLGNYDTALHYYQEALGNAYLTGDLLNCARTLFQIAEVYKSLRQSDSSLHYAQQAFITSNRISLSTKLLASNLLVKLYQASKHLDSAFYYQEEAIAIKDSLLGPKKFQQLQLLTLAEQERVQQLQEEQKRSKARIQITGLLLVLGVFLLVVLILWRMTRQQQQANRTLNLKNNQIEKQRNELEQTLAELKMAQAQLIHQEKMASLGELTAGIAHEIQNPLNFVNNFSEVNLEMTNELKGKLKELGIGTRDKEEFEELLNDIENNENKIIHHGKRADAIVKGMLLHSRTNTGQKAPTDINALTDEYLRLSHHGMMAKDKSFNTTIKTDFDQNAGTINIVPQDYGRVLLNLFNNAFYAVKQKRAAFVKSSSSSDFALTTTDEEYEPIVSVGTKKLNNKIEITVKDNGIGIPQKIADKIFQPFFTTKPSGQGTGLGLSLSYDIIKAHGWEISVESMEGNGADFLIRIPTG